MYNNLGKFFLELGKLDEAAVGYNNAITINPNYAEAHSNLGVVLQELGQLDEAVRSYNKALAIKPDNAEVYSNLGVTLKDLGQLDAALASFNRAIAVKPDHVEAHSNLGVVLQGLGLFNEAISSYQNALTINPDYAEAHLNLGIALLQTGEFKKGWKEYNWRLQVTGGRDFAEWVKMWEGSSLQGKNILVYAHGGVGDEILFSSCIPDLIQKSPNKIYLECDPRLQSLFSRSFPGIFTYGKKRDLDLSWVGDGFHLDYSVPIDGLPRFFRNHIDDFPKRDAFLIPNPKFVEVWKKRLMDLGKGLKIGISWCGSTGKLREKSSIPLDSWKQILSLDALFINLQYGDVSDEIAQISDGNNIRIYDWDDNDPLLDLDNQAALISTLDLVISVDNATVHSCGALGTQVWNIMDPANNLMWLENNTNSSPFYPHVLLFKKESQNNWDTVLKHVEAKLCNLITSQ